MKNNRHNLKLVFALVVVAMTFLMACETMPKAEVKDSPIALFKGEWASVEASYKDSSLEGLYAETAKKLTYYTAEGFKDSITSMYSCSVVKATFDGTNKVKFVMLDENNKEKTLTCKYVYKGKVEDRDYEGSFWETFELAKVSKGMSGVKYFIAMPPHGHGDGPKHWHARFGKDMEHLLGASGHWPTFMKASIPYSKLVNDNKEMIPNMVKYVDNPPFKKYAKIGKWTNRAIIFDNKSAEVDAAYTKLIKEFAGKNPKGGNFTKAEIVKIMKDTYGPQPFTHGQFFTDNDKNELVLWNGEKEVFRSSYKRVARTEARPGQITFMSDKKNAGKFKILAMTGVHGDPAHFHFWYGEKEADLNNFTGAPTGMPGPVSNETVAEAVYKVGNYYLNKFINK